VFFACSDWLTRRWLASTIHLRANRRERFLNFWPLVAHKITFWSANYSACVEYTKTIIHLSVGESDGYLPPLRWIIVNYNITYLQQPWRIASVNPLTPVPAVTGRGEPQSFFHFWGNPFWPNLASSTLNLCRRKTSFQWCPDQGDWPNGARDMHKIAQKVEWKFGAKFPAASPGCSIVTFARLDDAFLRVF